MRRSAVWIVFGTIALLASGCGGASSPPAVSPSPLAPSITGLPIRLTVKQRSTTPIAGSRPPISLTLDDITRGQVLATIVGPQGEALLASTSFEEGHSAAFQFGSETYSLTLENLDNALIGEDFATFSVDVENGGLRTEDAKIEILIQRVAALPGAVFLRNGAEHSPQEASEHLRKKWEASRDDIKTASQFITEIASNSSVTGQAYQIRRADGRIEPADPFLRTELAKLGPARLELAKPESVPAAGAAEPTSPSSPR